MHSDILIVCKKIEKKYLDLPPVLVTDVLSPSTASKDRGEKMQLYQMQAVNYYLIVDAQFKKIEIYLLQDNQYQPISINPESFTFTFDSCRADIKFTNLWE